MPGSKTAETRSKISDLSVRVEEVLLRLLTDAETLCERLETEIQTREKDITDVRDLIKSNTNSLQDALDKEKSDREAERENLQSQIDRLAKESAQEREEIKNELRKENLKRIEETKALQDLFSKENEERKRQLDEVSNWIKTENEKRMAEAEALKARLEREKQELRDYMEQDKKATREKLSKEEEERKRQEEEMKKKLQEQQAASENEIIQLYKRMADENNDRIREIDELREKFAQEKSDMRDKLEKEKNEIVARLQKENEDLKNQLDSAKSGLKTEIDDNRNCSTRRINDIAEKLSSLIKDSKNGLNELTTLLNKESKMLRQLLGQPLSVYFNAYRSEDYTEGGEAYLTFTGTYTNLGGGMDTKSGIFTTPVGGSYLFSIHVCTLDLHKALLSMRLNGKEVACFYDQNHESNHKNSMVSQTILLNLEVGDKVQIYMFTATGIQDRGPNRLTQFVGVLLRPKGFDESLSNSSLSLTNGHS